MSRNSNRRSNSADLCMRFLKIGLKSGVIVSTAFMLTACAVATGGDSEGPIVSTNPPAPADTNPPPKSNTAPVTIASDIVIELPTDSANLTGSAADDGLPSGNVLSYTWEWVTGPSGPNNTPGVRIANANTAWTSARFAGGAGEYTLRFKASDGSLSGESTVRVTVKPNPLVYPNAPKSGSSGWDIVTPADEGMDVAKLDEARDYSLAAGQTGDEAGIITRHGRVVYTWGNTFKKYEAKSTTKSMGGLALLLALDDEKLALSDKASAKLPVFGTSPAVDTSPAPSGSLNDISLLQLATHTAGFSKSDQASTLKLLYTPGSTWSYSDQGLNWLADVLTQTYAQDLQPLMFSRVFNTLGIRAADVTWRNNAFRSQTLNVNGVTVARREFASGISADVDAMARVGLLMLRRGVWKDDLILSNAVTDLAHHPRQEVASATNADPANFTEATKNYGVLWWTNATGAMPGVPRDAYWAWGLHETFIIVIPSLDIVVARTGDHAWHPKQEDWNGDYSVIEPFFTPIVESVHP